MSMTLSSMRMAVDTVFLSLSWSRLPSFICASRLTEPRLQTALSLSEVFRVISVQRLELCTMPTCCCGLRMLQGSLNVIQGCPVSNSMVSILRQMVSAGTRLNSFSSPVLVLRSYSTYAASKFLPTLSCRSGVSAGENNVHSPASMTRFLNKVVIPVAVVMSCGPLRWVARVLCCSTYCSALRYDE